MNKLLILFLISISFNAMGKGEQYYCQNNSGGIEYWPIFCKTELEAISTNSINIKKSKKHYTGKHITLEAQNVKANLIFHMLADFSGYSLLMDANINREISFKRAEIPWDQVLNKLADVLNLKVKIFNNIIYVDTPASLRKYKPRKKRYHGSTLSLNFHDVKAAFLFNVLADFSGNSLLIDANIDKKISIKRNDIPWDQVLDEVSEFLNLKAKVSNGIIYVDTPISLWKYKHNKKKYSTPTLSLNFLSIKISHLFNIIAKFSGNSLVMGPNINEKINRDISIKRNDIPWDQVLDEVSEFLNLKAKISNGVIYVEEKKE